MGEDIREEVIAPAEGVEKVELDVKSEPSYSVKTEEFIGDYFALKDEKQKSFEKSLSELDARVAQKIEELRPEIVESVKADIKKEISELYDEKIAQYEKYIVVSEAKAEVVDEVKDEGEMRTAEENSVVEPTPTV